MLRLRILTAAIGLPAVIWLFYSGPSLLKIACLTICAMISIYEMTKILFPTVVHDPRNLEGIDAAEAEKYSLFYSRLLLLAAGVVLWFGAGNAPISRLTVGAIVLLVLIAIIPAALSGRGVRYSFMLAACGLFSISYAFLPWLLIADMTHGPFSQYAVLFLMAIVWAGDTGGYFGGRFLGRRPLAPSISPKKTIEGSICGLLASCLAGLIFKFSVAEDIGSIVSVAIVSLIGGGLGQVGDLIESLSKRYGAVKDSGKLFPGHGGLLDRVDALLMSAPVVWIYFNL
jgi:phosphatidate cytidylyltransferase